MSRRIALLLSISAAFVLSGCKQKVDVIDIEAHNNHICALHSTNEDVLEPISCWGLASSLPTGAASEVGDAWQATLVDPTDIAILGNGLCVVDNDINGGTVKCLDKASPSVEYSRLLPPSAAAELSQYDVKEVKLASVSNDQLDFIGCALGEIGLGERELICWSKGGVQPFKWREPIYIAGFDSRLIHIFDFDLARNQVCVKGETTTGEINTVCLLPGSIGTNPRNLDFTGSTVLPNNLRMAAGGRDLSIPEDTFCFEGLDEVVGCSANIDLTEELYRWEGFSVGPKESVYHYDLATVCATDLNEIICAGNEGLVQLTLDEQFHPEVDHIDDVAIAAQGICYTATKGDRYGVICAGTEDSNIQNVPSYMVP